MKTVNDVRNEFLNFFAGFNQFLLQILESLLQGFVFFFHGLHLLLHFRAPSRDGLAILDSLPQLLNLGRVGVQQAAKVGVVYGEKGRSLVKLRLDGGHSAAYEVEMNRGREMETYVQNILLATVVFRSAGGKKT